MPKALKERRERKKHKLAKAVSKAANAYKKQPTEEHRRELATAEYGHAHTGPSVGYYKGSAKHAAKRRAAGAPMFDAPKESLVYHKLVHKK